MHLEETISDWQIYRHSGILTLYHPMLEIWYPHDGRHPKSRNGRDGLVHGSIWMLFVRRKQTPSADALGFPYRQYSHARNRP